jgi:hypothetical protein
MEWEADQGAMAESSGPLYKQKRAKHLIIYWASLDAD